MFLPNWLALLLLSSSHSNAFLVPLPREEKEHMLSIRPPSPNERPLVPRYYDPTEDFPEGNAPPVIAGKIFTRYPNVPIGRLRGQIFENVPFSSVDLHQPRKISILDELEGENDILYTIVSAIRYSLGEDVIWVNTLLMSPAARKIKHFPWINMSAYGTSQAVRVLKFKDGTDAILFFNPFEQEHKNQIVFVVKDEYYMTITSSLGPDKLQEIIESHLVFQ